jgi:hypothetical protein
VIGILTNIDDFSASKETLNQLEIVNKPNVGSQTRDAGLQTHLSFSTAQEEKVHQTSFQARRTYSTTQIFQIIQKG